MAEFRGRLKALSCADILEFLRVLNRRGLLTFTTEDAGVGLYLRQGMIVHAASTRASDRLSDLLVQWGLITQEQCEDAMRRAAEGERLGRSLIEAGGLAPRALTEARQRRVRQIAASLFEWEEGEFVFHEGETPPDAEVEVEIPITRILMEGVRSVRNAALFRRRMPFDDWVFETIPEDGARGAIVLDPHERYILKLVDGTRTTGQIGALSEFGFEETLRTLFLLFVVGLLKMKSQVSEDEDHQGPDGIEGILSRYNGMFGLVYQYLMKEVGPISEHLLSRTLSELSVSHAAVFHRASLGGDGTIDAQLMIDNVRSLASRRRRETLIQGLNELLYAELLVLRKTLGSGHEGRILRALRDIPHREAEAGP